MTFGYLLVVAKHSTIDYLKLAYALALSIKITQRAGFDKVALVIDDPARLGDITSPWVFDEIIVWDQETYWNGRSWMDILTPWDYTVCLDADMLFVRDHSDSIEQMINNGTELFLPSAVYTYRGTVAVDTYYRRTFVANELPNLYSLFTFFKKDAALCKEFFDLGRYIINHPAECSNLYLNKYIPSIVGTDEALSLAAKLLEIEGIITYPTEFPKVVHLKPMLQGWAAAADKVSDRVGFYFDLTAQIKIGNFQQFDILHYHEKELITTEHVSILERIIWSK